tara:strand:- start:1353 stop:1523 length:171 start_codon:yes stop_codon:yes gene_type:complete
MIKKRPADGGIFILLTNNLCLDSSILSGNKLCLIIISFRIIKNIKNINSIFLITFS